MKTNAKLFGILLITLANGCSTVPDAYRPSIVGHVNDSIESEGLQVTIHAANDRAVVGDTISFRIKYENVGAKSFIFPKNPDILFTWTYSNGKRDNYLNEVPTEEEYASQDLVQMDPGDSITRSFSVETYYFKTHGITEFRAILRCPQCSNPRLSAAWHGRAVSNGYGILLSKQRDYASMHRPGQAASIPERI